MHYFSTLSWYTTLHVSDALSIIRSLDTVFREIGVCHAIYVDCLLSSRVETVNINIMKNTNCAYTVSRILMMSSVSETCRVVLTFCWPCIAVYLSQYLTNLMHKICFTINFISCLYMFRVHVLIIRRSKLHYTASGIITPIGGRLVHRLTEAVQCNLDLLMMSTCARNT